MAAKLFLSILLITCYCSVTLAQMPVDCCLQVSTKQIPKSLVANYHHQTSGQGCPIDATVFVSRSGRTMCAPRNEKWVEDLVKHVVQLRKFCKKATNQIRRCVGLKFE